MLIYCTRGIALLIYLIKHVLFSLQKGKLATPKHDFIKRLTYKIFMSFQKKSREVNATVF